MIPDETWDRILAATKVQVTADVRELERRALMPGDWIAWGITERGAYRNGPTVGFSELHRVGEPISGEAYAVCREKIPAPIRWVALSPDLVRTMPRCGHCEAGIARLAHEEAA